VSSSGWRRVSRRKINIITSLLLGLGLGAALVIFLAAPPETTDGDSLRNDPRAQRLYQRQLAMYGGKANVLSAEFLEWFDGLWCGRTLAGTVSVLTVTGALAFRFFALRLRESFTAAAEKEYTPERKA
jgi:hypothetical protein